MDGFSWIRGFCQATPMTIIANEEENYSNCRLIFREKKIEKIFLFTRQGSVRSIDGATI